MFSLEVELALSVIYPVASGYIRELESSSRNSWRESFDFLIANPSCIVAITTFLQGIFTPVPL